MADLPPRYARPCGTCGATPTRVYVIGPCCKDHTPAKNNGRPEPPKPDPARTLEGLRAAAGADPSASFTPASPTGIDSQRVASGKKRTNTAAHRIAREHVETHR